MNSSSRNNDIRIGIISLYHNSVNYGGLAQAYALNTFFERKGYHSELISYKRIKPRKSVESGSIVKKLSKYPLKKALWKVVCKVSDKLFVNRFKPRFSERSRRLNSFRENCIPHSKEVTEDTIAQCKTEYDVFVSGSDQIWKPGVVDDGFVFNFLEPSDEKLVFSYASSVSVDSYPDGYVEFMRKSLQKYACLSVREESTAKRFRELLDRDVSTCVDPTLLVDRDVWYKLSSARMIQENYLFCYMLGDDIRQRKQIKVFAKKHKLKLVTIPYIKDSSRFEFRLSDINFGDTQLYDVGLEDFLSLIKYADFVITDSFHAGVFSFVFRKNFYIFERPTDKASDSMNVRIYDLLDLYGLNDRIVKATDDLNQVSAAEIDYEIVQANVEVARIESIHYIEKAMNGLK